MSSNIYNHNSSVRDIGKLFPEEKRLGTKASDLVSGIALTACLDIDEAFDGRNADEVALFGAA